ncbi:MAG: hypothetical protein JST40_09240 [Armatimonadetes bacterium]|nr:hypothetical protein [Armatimonadota bacterium]
MISAVLWLGLMQTHPPEFAFGFDPYLGELVTYRQTAKYKSQGETFETESEIIIKATERDSRGYVTVKSSDRLISMTMDGEKLAIGTTKPTELKLTMNKSGSIWLMTQHPIDLRLALRLGRLTWPNFGTEKRAAGSTWSAQFKADEEYDLGSAKASYNLVRIQTNIGSPATLVKFDFEESDGDNPIKATGEYELFARSGFLKSAKIHAVNVPIFGGEEGEFYELNLTLTALKSNVIMQTSDGMTREQIEKELNKPG